MKDLQIRKGLDSWQSVQLVVIEVELLDIGEPIRDMIDNFNAFVIEMNGRELVVLKMVFDVLLEAMAQH